MKERIIKDFYDAWWFLDGHPVFVETFSHGLTLPNFQRALDIHVAKVSPKSNHVCDDNRKNTKTRIWLECGPWESAKEMIPKGVKIQKGFYGTFSHDIKLDCGADTFEEAIIKLANLVLKEYGDYKKEEE